MATALEAASRACRRGVWAQLGGSWGAMAAGILPAPENSRKKTDCERCPSLSSTASASPSASLGSVEMGLIQQQQQRYSSTAAASADPGKKAGRGNTQRRRDRGGRFSGRREVPLTKWSTTDLAHGRAWDSHKDARLSEETKENVVDLYSKHG
mmetsp:Transcript_12412/g.31509  ORF Transcript_12412/g.31509 Transcript_12412/m.31509 type:complete len:153 (+) Transcript_12412:29-487(+)